MRHLSNGAVAGAEKLARLLNGAADDDSVPCDEKGSADDPSLAASELLQKVSGSRSGNGMTPAEFFGGLWHTDSSA